MDIYGIKLSLARRNVLRKIGFKKCGHKSIIYKPLFVKNKNKIILGNNVSIINGARIELIDKWYDQKFEPSLIIGDFTSFEQNAHIISAGKLIIGSNCVFSARVMITNISHDYASIGTNVLKQPLIIKEVVIGNNCFFGMDTKVFPGVKVGNNVIVGANSIITHDIPDNCVVVGCPARIIKKYNTKTKRWENVNNE